MISGGHPPQLLLLSTTASVGGVERIVGAVSSGLALRQWKVRTVFPDWADQRFINWCRAQGIEPELSPNLRKWGGLRGDIGAAATTGDIVVFTDDDCEPERDWLASIVTALCDCPEAGIAFGSVIPGPHDPDDGFIVGFAPTRRQRLRGRLSKLRDKGISANVGLRRSALQASGGFDEMLGPGSYFPCAEDYDLTYRVLSRGYTLVHEPRARVLHHGLRDWRSGSSLVRGTYVAIGAAYMKHVRLGDAIGAALLANELWLALLNILLHILRARGPFGFGRLRGLLLGMWRSFELEVEPGHALYTAPGLRLTARSSADSPGRVPVGPSDSAAKTARL